VLVEVDALKAAQLAGDMLAANAALMDAYNTDVRPLLAEPRAEMGLAPDPVAAYLAPGYGEAISSERRTGSPRAGEHDTDKRRHAEAAGSRRA
jgi:L-rhamnose isomerase/sugar isomerase